MKVSISILGLAASLALTAAAAVAVPPHAGASARMNVPPVSHPPMPRPVMPPMGMPQSRPAMPATLPAHATLTAISGNTVTVRLPNGSLQTFNVSSDTAAELRASIDKPIEFRVVNGMLSVTGHEGMSVLHGTVSAVNGNMVTIRFRNGSTQTIDASAQTAAELLALMNRPVAFRVNNGLFAFAGAQGGSGPVRATLTAVSGNTATVRFSNGVVQTFMLSSGAAARLNAHVGQPIIVRFNADGTIRLERRPQL